jgi:pentatricopeptide repeat protein
LPLHRERTYGKNRRTTVKNQFNTLGRARVILREAGWKELFQRSQDILLEWDPTDLPRTWCYLVHGLLRNSRLTEAWEMIRQLEAQPGPNELSRWFLRFYQAEHASLDAHGGETD